MAGLQQLSFDSRITGASRVRLWKMRSGVDPDVASLLAERECQSHHEVALFVFEKP
jgi:hypothetical protein